MVKVKVIYFGGRFYAYVNKHGKLYVTAVYKPQSDAARAILLVAWGVALYPNNDDPVVGLLESGYGLEDTHFVYLIAERIEVVEAKDAKAIAELEKRSKEKMLLTVALPPSGSLWESTQNIRAFRKAFFRFIEEGYAKYQSDYTQRVKLNALMALRFDELLDLAQQALTLVVKKLTLYEKIMAYYGPLSMRRLGSHSVDLTPVSSEQQSTATYTNLKSGRVRMMYLEGRYYACAKRKDSSGMLELLGIYKADATVPHGLLSVAWGVAGPGDSAELPALLAARTLSTSHNVRIVAGKLRFEKRPFVGPRNYVVEPATLEETARYVKTMETCDQIGAFRDCFRSAIGNTGSEVELYFKVRVAKNAAYRLRRKKLKRYALDAYVWLDKHRTKFEATSAPFSGTVRGLLTKDQHDL